MSTSTSVSFQIECGQSACCVVKCLGSATFRELHVRFCSGELFPYVQIIMLAPSLPLQPCKGTLLRAGFSSDAGLPSGMARVTQTWVSCGTVHTLGVSWPCFSESYPVLTPLHAQWDSWSSQDSCPGHLNHSRRTGLSMASSSFGCGWKIVLFPWDPHSALSLGLKRVSCIFPVLWLITGWIFSTSYKEKKLFYF
jgi:hypothetical protein